MDPVTGLYGQADRTDRQIETETKSKDETGFNKEERCLTLMPLHLVVVTSS